MPKRIVFLSLAIVCVYTAVFGQTPSHRRHGLRSFACLGQAALAASQRRAE
jgi:hypothetical protein